MNVTSIVKQLADSKAVKVVSRGSPTGYRRERVTLVTGGGRVCSEDFISVGSLPVGGKIERVSCSVFPVKCKGLFEMQISNPGGMDSAIKMEVKTGMAAQSVNIDCQQGASIFTFFTPAPDGNGVIDADVHVGWGCSFRPSSQVVSLEETYIWE